jgi:hypothetical protein
MLKWHEVAGRSLEAKTPNGKWLIVTPVEDPKGRRWEARVDGVYIWHRFRFETPEEAQVACEACATGQPIPGPRH